MAHDSDATDLKTAFKWKRMPLRYRVMCWFGLHKWTFSANEDPEATQGRCCLHCGKIEWFGKK